MMMSAESGAFRDKRIERAKARPTQQAHVAELVTRGIKIHRASIFWIYPNVA